MTDLIPRDAAIRAVNLAIWKSPIKAQIGTIDASNDTAEALRAIPAIEPQPDPRDEVIARLVEALGECRQAITDYMNQYPHMAKGYLVDAEQHARAALAAAKAVLK